MNMTLNAWNLIGRLVGLRPNSTVRIKIDGKLYAITDAYQEGPIILLHYENL